MWRQNLRSFCITVKDNRRTDKVKIWAPIYWKHVRTCIYVHEYVVSLICGRLFERCSTSCNTHLYRVHRIKTNVQYLRLVFAVFREMIKFNKMEIQVCFVEIYGVHVRVQFISTTIPMLYMYGKAHA